MSEEKTKSNVNKKIERNKTKSVCLLGDRIKQVSLLDFRS